MELKQLKGQRVCTVRGYIYPLALRQAGVKFDEALDDTVNLERVSLKRCEYVVLEHAVGEYLLNKPDAAKLRSQVSWVEPAFVVIPLSFGVIAERQGSASLLLALERGFVNIKRNRQYQKLLTRYGLEIPSN